MSELAVGLAGRTRQYAAAAGSSPAAAALAFSSIVLLGVGDGGFYPDTWRWATLAFGAVAGIQLTLGRSPRPSRLGIASLAALVGLAAWMLLSDVWGVGGTDARREAERCFLYVAALGALLAVARRGTARALLAGLLGGITALALFALVQHALGDPGLDPYQGALLREPLGYANALGLLAAVGSVLALGLASELPGPIARSAALVAGGVCAVALALTSSRGAWLALLTGVVVLAVCRLRSRSVAAALVAGALLVVMLALPRASFGDRPAYWRVALGDAADHALVGSGAGSFDDVWLERRAIPAFVRDAHSLYLETAAELGVVGLALLLIALGAPLVAAARARDRRLVATAAAGYTVLLVHAGLDWDWEMPVTVLSGLTCAAVLLAVSASYSAEDRSARPRLERLLSRLADHRTTSKRKGWT